MAEIITASIPKADMAALVDQIKRAEKVLGKSTKAAVQMAGRNMVISLGAITKISEKKRKIFERPDKQWLTDHRVARWGTYKYSGGKKYWVPIHSRGAHGKVTYKTLKSKRVMVWDKATGEHKPIEFANKGKADKDQIEMSKHPYLIIRRRRLAKRSWMFLKARMRVGGSIQDYKTGTGIIGAVVWRGIGGVNPTLIINNKLRYAMTALKGGEAALGGVVGNASRNMARKITKRLEGKY